ncbi:MAG: AMP-binding protein, partial [Deltaproteobacteria bacterium]|nr:AMP-binding protein [Deltaproteobacteria bacterium]
DRVGMMLPRVPELIIAFLGAAKAGAVAAPINFELPIAKIKGLVKKLAPRFLVAYGAFVENGLASVEDTGASVVSVGPEDPRAIAWEEFLKFPSTRPSIDIRPEDTVYLNYTSGSTGDSKGAITTHANVYWNTLASIEALGLKEDDIHLCMFAPFAHPHELLARPLFLGGTMVLVDTIYPKAIAEAISKHRVTCMMGLAPMYENLLELTEHKAYDLSTLRLPESGGMYTRGELMARFASRLGVSIIPVWGSTETTGIAIANRPGTIIPPGSVGRPCPHYEVGIVDEGGLDVGPGEVGELVFRGPGVVSGYFEGANASNGASSFKEGWYHSGDLATKDTDGFFYFVERKSGMMKVAGLKVYPAEIEKALLEHPLIREASVVSVKDDLRGEVPKAYITLKKGAALTAREALKFCRERLAHYKVPRHVEFLDELPKTTSGKINKKALQTEGL